MMEGGFLGIFCLGVRPIRGEGSFQSLMFQKFNNRGYFEK